MDVRDDPWPSELKLGWVHGRTRISACSWPFCCVTNVSRDDVKVVVHAEDAGDAIGGRSASIAKREMGDGKKAAPDEEDDQRRCDFAPRRCLWDGVVWDVQSGVMGIYS
jgi:hypothetical protein